MHGQSKRYLAFLLLLCLFTGSFGNVWGEEASTPSPSLLEATCVETTSEPALAPTSTPVPMDTPASTDNPVPMDTPTSAGTPMPTPAPADTTPISTSTPEATPLKVLPTITPSSSPAAAQTAPAPLPFLRGLVKLATGAILYSDSALSLPIDTLTGDGIGYAIAGDAQIPATKLFYTIDGHVLSEAYLPPDAYLPLMADELAAYALLQGGLPYESNLLFALSLASKLPPMITPTPIPDFTRGAVMLPAQTVLYASGALTRAVGTLDTDGAVYLLPIVEGKPLHIQYTLDGANVQSAYLPITAAYLPIMDDALATYLARESAAHYESVPLFALSITLAISYEQQMYGFPGLPISYTLSEEELEAKRIFANSGILKQLEEMTPDADYISNEVLALTDSREYAVLAADGYGATVESFSDGLAVLKLPNNNALQAVRAACDPAVRLIAVYLNYCYYIEAPFADGGSMGDFSHGSMRLFTAAPRLKTWDDYRNGDLFVTDPSEKTQYTKPNAKIAIGYQYMHDVIGSYGAWGLTMGDADVTACVIDSGINAAGSELSGKVTSINADGFGLTDSAGHGTHVAGIIAAKQGNGAGGAGVAPNVSLLSYRCANEFGGITSAAICAGLNAAINNGAWVINMSLGGYQYDLLTNSTIQRCIDAGIPVIAAAGNTGSQTAYYPAQYDNVISVASSDPTNRRSPFSTYGTATLSAPGSYILSTVPDGFMSKNGTSMACPVVTGVVALYYSALGTKDLNGDGSVNKADVATLRKALTSACSPVNGSAVGMGAGIVNITNMFAKIVSKPSILLLDQNGAPYTNTLSKVPSTALVKISAGYNGDFLIYTTDGTKPSIKGGEVVNGTAVSKASVLSLKDFPAGKATIKAMSCNAQGIASGVNTSSFTIDNLTPASVAINGPRYVGVGKSVSYTASILPVTKSVKAKWSLEGAPAATISQSSGRLRVLKTAQIGSSITLNADAGTAHGDLSVEIISPVKSLALLDEKGVMVNSKRLTLNVGDKVNLTPEALLSDGSTINGAQNLDYQLTATAKKAKVGVSGSSIVLEALSAGSATLTITALDGSGKRASVSFTIKQAVEELSITGGDASVLAYGKSRTIRPVISPANATNKGVTWSLAGNVPGGVKLSGSGALYIAKDASLAGKTVTVQCASKDQPMLIATQAVTIASPVLSLKLTSNDPKIIRNKSGIITGGMLFTRDIASTEYDTIDAPNQESQLQLSFDATGSSQSVAPVLWSTSNPKIATVDGVGGLVTAVAAGYVTITCKAADQSGRQASVRLRIINPSPNISIAPTNSTNTGATYATLATGKSLSFGVTFGNEFGKPSIKAANWSYELRCYPNAAYLYDMDNQNYFSTVEDQRRLISLSASGRLSVNKAFLSTLQSNPSDYYVKVTAAAADRSGARASYFVLLCKPTLLLRAMTGSFDAYAANGDKEATLTSTASLTAHANGRYCYFASDLYAPEIYVNLYDLKLTTSNVRVASAVSVQKSAYYAKIGNVLYPLYSIVVKGDQAGRATIKVATNDGTGKSCSFGVRVY